MFTNGDVALEGDCEGCGETTVLPVKCVCKKVAYCNKECMEKDKKYHYQNCEKCGEEEEDD